MDKLAEMWTWTRTTGNYVSGSQKSTTNMMHIRRKIKAKVRKDIESEAELRISDTKKKLKSRPIFRHARLKRN